MKHELATQPSGRMQAQTVRSAKTTKGLNHLRGYPCKDGHADIRPNVR